MTDKFEIYKDVKEELGKDYVTRSEMIEAIHENNKDYRRWLIGTSVTLLIGIPAIIKILSHL